MIFLDHIPHDVVSWLTLRNYGFSDAAEFFVFISGYLVGWIYAPIVRGGLFLAAVKRLWKRVAQMYVAHIMLFLIFTAQIARTAKTIRQSDVRKRIQCLQFPAASGRADRTGAHAAIQAGQSRRAAALYHLGVRSAIHRVVPRAPPEPDLAWFYRALHSVALVRLEHRVLSAGYDLVFQSVLLAAPVRVRRLVRCRRDRKVLANGFGRKLPGPSRRPGSCSRLSLS